MKTTTVPVNFSYTRKELKAIFNKANELDVEKGGRFDARAGVINVWSHSWVNEAAKKESTIMGTLYADWAENRIYLIELDEWFSIDDLLPTLGILEYQALGRIVHGTVKFF